MDGAALELGFDLANHLLDWKWGAKWAPCEPGSSDIGSEMI
jgi:hypothetical protein